MHLIEHFNRMFAYEEWATQEIYQSLHAITTDQIPYLKIFAHIVAVKELWLIRLQGLSKSVIVWPSLSLSECYEKNSAVYLNWQNYLKELDPNQLTATVTYQNSLGQIWSSGVLDILTQTLLHSAYHRGQIALQLRTNAVNPPITDYIYCIREGFLTTNNPEMF